MGDRPIRLVFLWHLHQPWYLPIDSERAPLPWVRLHALKDYLDLASVFAEPFHSPWIFDVEMIARYIALPAGPGQPARRDRIYELAVASWHHVPGSKLRWTDFARAVYELFYIHRKYRL